MILEDTSSLKVSKKSFLFKSRCLKIESLSKLRVKIETYVPKLPLQLMKKSLEPQLYTRMKSFT